MNAAKVLVFGSETVPRLWLVPTSGTIASDSMPEKQTDRKPGEPLPSREKLHAIEQLKKATLAHCEAWWAWRWGAKLDPALSGLDYRGRIEAWPKVAESEDRSRKVLSNLKAAIQEALTEGNLAKTFPFVGFHAQSLKEIEPDLLRIEQAIEGLAFAFATTVPVQKPTRREWLTLIVEPRFGTKLEAEELARYSILAGFWPKTVPGERHPIESGISVKGALSEEKRNIRVASAENAKARRGDLTELDVMSETDLLAFGLVKKTTDSQT